MSEIGLDQTMSDLRLIAAADWEPTDYEDLVNFGEYSNIGATDLNRADPDDDHTIIHYTRQLLAITLRVFEVWSWIPDPDAPDPNDAVEWICRTYEIKTREDV